MAIAKLQVVDLKAKLEKAKEAAWAAKVATDVSEQKYYDLEVQEIEACLIKELARVYRKYCQKMLTEALNLAGVPTALKWRRAENVYYPQDLREVPAALLGPEADAAFATTVPK